MPLVIPKCATEQTVMESNPTCYYSEQDRPKQPAVIIGMCSYWVCIIQVGAAEEGGVESTCVFFGTKIDTV